MPTTINPSGQTITQYNIQTGGASNLLNNVAPSATSGVPVISQGAASQPIFGTVAIAGGGTNATSFGTSGGIVVYNGTSLVNYAGPKLSTGGVYTNSSQPAFMASMATALTNKTGDGTVYTVLFDTTNLANGITYASGTGLATVPVAGNYFFYAQILITSIGVAHTGSMFDLQQGVSATNFFRQDLNPATCRALSGDTNDLTLTIQGFIPLAASDTMKVNVTVLNSTKTVGVFGAANQLYTTFGGWLVS